jgi:hypothetical protein
MALSDKKITENQIIDNGVISAPDKLTGTASENKAVFDKLIRAAVAPQYNALIDELMSHSGAGNIGAAVAGLTGTTVQTLLEALKANIDNVVVEAGAMTSFNGRNGDVLPESGDYTADQITETDKKFTSVYERASWDSRINPNYLINGNSQVWQRGESFTLTRNSETWQYCDDRWRYKFTGETDAIAVVSKNPSGGVKITITGTGTVTRQQVFENTFTGTLTSSINGVKTSSAFSGTTVEQTFSSTSVVDWTKLEAGSVSTPFSPRPYGEELILCQRYYEKGAGATIWSAKNASNAQRIAPIFYKVEKRANPIITLTNSRGEPQDLLFEHSNTTIISGYKINTSTASTELGYIFTADAEIYE